VEFKKDCVMIGWCNGWKVYVWFGHMLVYMRAFDGRGGSIKSVPVRGSARTAFMLTLAKCGQRDAGIFPLFKPVNLSLSEFREMVKANEGR